MLDSEICVSSQESWPEGSVSALIEGRSYNRAVRFHKLSYEAFRRPAWAGFLPWIAAQINKELEDI